MDCVGSSLVTTCNQIITWVISMSYFTSVLDMLSVLELVIAV